MKILISVQNVIINAVTLGCYNHILEQRISCYFQASLFLADTFALRV